jgi:hypothetical protein
VDLVAVLGPVDRVSYVDLDATGEVGHYVDPAMSVLDADQDGVRSLRA